MQYLIYKSQYITLLLLYAYWLKEIKVQSLKNIISSTVFDMISVTLGCIVGDISWPDKPLSEMLGENILKNIYKS